MVARISGLKVYLLVALGAGIVGTGIGWKAHSLFTDSAALKELRTQQAAYNQAVEERDALSRQYHTLSEELEARLQAIRSQKVEVKIHEVPIYNECVLPADGMHELNRIISAVNRSRRAR